MADYAPADIPVLFDDIRLTGDGPGGSDSQFEKILIYMEKRFPPDEVWGVIDRMLRDTKYHNVHTFRPAPSQPMRMATLPVCGMIFCTTCARTIRWKYWCGPTRWYTLSG